LFEIFKDRTKKNMAVIDAFINPIVEAKLAKKRATGNVKIGSEKVPADASESNDDDETLLDHLVNFTDDTKVIHDELFNIMIAGRDTTSSTITFATYCLAMYPHVLAKLREEILTVVGGEKHATYDDLRNMKYLRAVINEVLRLYPPVPFNIRRSVNSTTWTISGQKYYIPADAAVPYSVMFMHRRKDLWGPDAEEFDPERWLDERLHKYVTPNPFIFLPFNAGPRICLGQQFAYNESSFFMVRLLQKYDQITLAPDAQPAESLPPPEWKNGKDRRRVERFRPKTHLTMYADGGLWVKMKEAVGTEEV